VLRRDIKSLLRNTITEISFRKDRKLKRRDKIRSEGSSSKVKKIQI